MAFYRETPVKAIRKPRSCIACHRTIEVGHPALDCAGYYEGDFWSATYHAECREAEVALNKVYDLPGGEWVNLGSDMDWEDWPWLIEKFPTVAERMGITTERFDRVNTDYQQRHSFWRSKP